MSARLVAEQGLDKGTEFSFLKDEEWILGRDPDSCQFIIEDPKVSREHARCHRLSGGIILENLSSTNPIYINDEIIKGPVFLKEGDHIQIGDTRFRYQAEAGAPFLKKDPEEDPEEDQGTEPQENLNDENSDSSIKTEVLTTDFPIQPSSSDTLQISDSLIHEEDPTFYGEDDGSEYYEVIYEEQEVSFGPPMVTITTSKDLEKEAHETSLTKTEATLLDGEHKTDDSKEDSLKTDGEESLKFLLKILSGPDLDKEFPLETGHAYTIGSEETTCDIFINDEDIFLKHAHLKIDDSGNLEISTLKDGHDIKISGETINSPKEISLNQLISLGSSSFQILDPSITEEDKAIDTDFEKESFLDEFKGQLMTYLNKIQLSKVQMVLFSIATALIFIVGLGTFSLFYTEDSVEIQMDTLQEISAILNDYPDVEFKFSNGELFVLGHVSTKVRQEQFLHLLNTLKDIQKIESHIVIDEYVWQEINAILAKNLEWRGITMHSPIEGRFVLTGYLKTREDSLKLNDYVHLNFPYLNRLENKVVVEDFLIDEISVSLIEKAFHDIFVEIIDGELTLSGYMPSSRTTELDNLINRFKNISGIRSVKNFTVELAPEDSMIDLSDDYQITGHFKQANISMSIIINGKILARGDRLNGMTITSIKPDSILLEKDGVKFRIDYKK